MILSVIAAFTPGPNNSMLMQSGIYFGLAETRRHIAGIVAGFSFLFFCINMGIYALITRFSLFDVIIKSIGSVYFAYLAYRMIRLTLPAKGKDEDHTSDSADPDGGDGGPQGKKQYKPLGFWAAFFFQWINIKAWFFALSALGSLPASRTVSTVLYSQSIIMLVSTCSALTWTLGGVFISSVFKNPLSLRIISILLALSLVYIGISQWF